MPDVGNGAERWDVVVAGAGIAGMAAAQVLVDAGLKVLVIEKAAAAGGKCMSYVDPDLGFTIEHGIHGVFPRYVNLRKLWSDAGIPSSIFSTTKTTGMAGADGRMHVTELARAHGPAPFFLLGLVPNGVLRLRDFLFSSWFLLRTYAAATSGVRNLDDTTFGALLRGTGVSARMIDVLLLPYVRNLTYARGDEVSAQVAVEALSYYVVEDSESVKAHWIDGGPSQVIFTPWQQELERRGVKFAFKTPVQSIAMQGDKFSAMVSREVISDKELGPSARVWTQQLGHHYLGLRWQPDKRRLTALNAICTHRGCPVKVADGAEPHYQCPCHGAQYDLDGKVLNPPATQPLPDVPMHHDEASGVWYVEGDGADSGGGADGGTYAADFAVVALDLPGVQQVLPKELLLDQATAGIPLLHTTSVMVLRMCFAARSGKPRWSGPDSGVFTADDLLDNFFAPHTFQKEFAQREELILECHIGDSERFAGLDDGSVFAQALQVLTKYFPEEDLATRFQAQRSRLLRHDDVFTLCAPGDLSRTPTVSSEARPNLMFAGDWVQTDDPSHRSFFMERAAVTGIEAANAVLKRKGLAAKQRSLECAQPPAVARALGFPSNLLTALRTSFRRLCGVE